MQGPLVSWPLLASILLSLLILYPGHAGASDAVEESDESAAFYTTDTVSGRVKRGAQFKRGTGIRTHPYTNEEKREILMKHNQLRGETVNAANMLMLEWDGNLEKEAQRWADRCDFNHPTHPRKIAHFGSVGQNLYVSTHEPALASNPVQSWYDEIVDYTYSTRGTCTPGKMCGHYTQIVWAKTQAVGCAIQYCNPLTSVSTFNKGYLVVCEYGPAGNYRGQYPYIRAKTCSKCNPETYKYCVMNLCSLQPYIGSSGTTVHTLTSPFLLTTTLGFLIATLLWYNNV